MNSKIVCSYIRLSEEDINKEDKKLSSSILNQIQYIENYAKSNNFIISKNYIDDGYTGINYNRPSFEEMKKDIENRKNSIRNNKRFFKTWERIL